MSGVPLEKVVTDLREEGDELYALVKDMDTGFWREVSSFKDWTVWDVIAHLHFSDHMALTSLQSASAFREFISSVAIKDLRGSTNAWLTGDAAHPPTGPELLERWRNTFVELCDTLYQADPDERFVWVGPGMKAKMFATARQMEIWAHGWEIYDLMGVQRVHTDRLLNIATIGVRTFGWTFNNRNLPVPHEPPHVHLQAPSGAIWEWHPAQNDNFVRGDAVAFCQVVTQVRNVADTDLQIEGDAAHAWMNIAQCFAGPPEDPPAPGSRVVTY